MQPYLRTKYVLARQQFTKKIRHSERQYYAKQREDICNFQTQNHKMYWSGIRK